MREHHIRKMPGHRRVVVMQRLREIRQAFREDAYEKCAKEPRTDWYPRGTHPTRVGYYERRFSDGIFLQYWDGKLWRIEEGGTPHWRQVNDYPMWRGLLRRVDSRAKGC